MLKARVITALAIAAVLLTVLFVLPPLAAQVLVTAVILLGAWEWARLLPPGHPLRAVFGAVIVALLALGWWQPWDAALMRGVLAVAALWWLIALLWILLAPQRGHPLLTCVAGWLALLPMWVAVLVLRGDSPRGAWVVLLGLLVIVAADTGAYFAGRRFGRLKLAPQVSPGKTWEGVIGGLLLATLVAGAGGGLFAWPLSQWLPLALAAAAVSVVGDLIESKMKRQAGVKDSGALFPGHGGVLDRIDSLSAGLPVLALGLDSLGWLA